MIGASLSKPHTAMHMCVYVWLLAWLQLYTVNFKWAYLNIRKDWTSLDSLEPAVGERLLPEGSIGVKETRSEDDSS